MKNTDTREVIMISIRLSSKNLQADYYPFILEPEARHLFLKKLTSCLAARDDLLDIHQHLEEILLTLDGHQTESYTFSLTLPHLIASILDACKACGKKQHWFHSLSACIAMDAGLSRPICLSISNAIPPVVQWTGLHAGRVSTLTREMAAGNSPSCLITHAFYKRLSPPMQARYTTLYYIRHICCYGAES